MGLDKLRVMCLPGRWDQYAWSEEITVRSKTEAIMRNEIDRRGMSAASETDR